MQAVSLSVPLQYNLSTTATLGKTKPIIVAATGDVRHHLYPVDSNTTLYTDLFSI